jgi:flagellar assembly factor FliW
MPSLPVATSNFGPIEVPEDHVLHTPNGLIGIPDLRWVLLTREPESPFMWVQSLETPEMALPVTLPEIFYPEYELAVPEALLSGLGLSEGHEVEVLCVVRPHEQLAEWTINLRGPLLFDAQTRIGGQLATLIEYPVSAQLWAERGINQIQIAHPALPILVVPREDS